MLVVSKKELAERNSDCKTDDLFDSCANFTTICGKTVKFTVPFLSLTCIESVSFAFVIGYFVLGCVSHYWFTRKYSSHQDLARSTMKFFAIFIVQGFAIFIFAALMYLTLYTDVISVDYTVLFFNYDVMPFFRVIIPVLFILRANKKCFE